MITTCTGCQARYRLDADKVPSRQLRVRCPECANVFELDGTHRPAALVDESLPGLEETSSAFVETPAPEVSPVEGPLVQEPLVQETLVDECPGLESTSLQGDIDLEPATPAAQVDPMPDLEAPAAATISEEPEVGVAVADAPRPSRRRRRDKTEMLARALVSDILVYNREARDKALEEGTLLQVLGPEIKKSWELFKEKVGNEAATDTTHFKDALNEILAEGKAIF